MTNNSSESNKNSDSAFNNNMTTTDTPRTPEELLESMTGMFLPPSAMGEVNGLKFLCLQMENTTLKAEVERLRELLNRAIREIEKAPFHAPKLTAFTAHGLAERYREEMTNNSTNTTNTQEDDK